MLTCIYVVEKIDGDYAELRRVDALAQDQEENKVMARALLPADIMEGNKILYENLQYRLITELLEPEFGSLYVTPPDIDERVRQLSFTISEGIHRALF